MQTRIKLTNDFHNTEVTLHINHLRNGSLILSAAQLKRAKQTLCADGCTCGGVAGERGKQPGDVQVEETLIGGMYSAIIEVPR